ncbi:MAG: hypothetical protein ACD_75C00760G0004 [uncultured bacterium]|nr:MAG: hypothetical protein ACD_75C00760G0004 [uncultured bacterium]
MDVGNAVLHRFDQDAVDQFDDRRVGGGKLFTDIIAGIPFDLKIIGRFGHNRAKVVDVGNIDLLYRFLGPAEQGLRLGIIDAVILFIGLNDIRFGGNADGELLVEEILQFLHRHRIGGLRHGNLQGAADDP